eukprot:COSAG02_NODE_25039_length_670_cov_1.301226_1_plen_64_part_10
MCGVVVDLGENITLRDAMRRAQVDTRILGFSFDRSKMRSGLRFMDGELSLDMQLPPVFFRAKDP